MREFDLSVEAGGFLRSANVKLKDRSAMLFVYSAGPDVDPGEELLQFKGIQPVHIALFTMDGTRLWEKVLPDGVLPGTWFVPAVPFDMDGDGEDEIYLVNNTGAPFSFLHRRLERLDARTGESTGSWPWPAHTFNERLSLCYRFYLAAGYSHGEPVLVTAQGTYENMYLQGWDHTMQKRWDVLIKDSDPGPRASHTTPVMDFNGDGVDELFWGERLLSLDDGHEVIDYAPDFHGHSDVVIPFMDYTTGEWYIYTCREGGEQPGVKRVVCFQKNGRIAWERIDEGHIHNGWIAAIGEDYGKIAMCMRHRFVPGGIGFEHMEDGIFFFDAVTGETVDPGLPCKGTDLLPIDINGDGYHEFLVIDGPLKNAILDRHGNVLDHLPQECDSNMGESLRLGKLMNAPGEQLLLQKKGTTLVQLYGDSEAEDGDIIRRRYAIPYLTFMQKLMASGYNCIGSHVACGV